MRFDYVLGAVLVSTSIIISMPSQLLAATDSNVISINELRQIAQDITVLINQEQGNGSGVIIANKGNDYYVLTAAHVLKLDAQSEIIAPDKRHYKASVVIGKLPNTDLAILKFQSNQNYRIATLTNYNLAETVPLGIGGSIYISGWKTSQFSKQLVFSCGATLKRDFTAFLRKDPISDGYELAYTNITQPGLSGGPILDNQGRVIGIHGRVEGDEFQLDSLKLGFSLGIPTQKFLQVVKQSSIQLPLLIDSQQPNNPLIQSWSGSDPCETNNTISLPATDADAMDWANYANSMLRLGKLVNALSAYEAAIKRNAEPELYQIWYGRGLTLLMLDRPNEALKTFDKALQLLGKSQPINTNDMQRLNIARVVLLKYKGMLLYGSKSYQEALAIYDEALKFKPDDYRIWMLRASVFQELNRYEEAIAAYHKAISIEPRPLLFISRSNLYSQLGQYQKAIDDLTAAIKFNPFDVQSYALRGALRNKLGDEKGRSSDYERVQKLTSLFSENISLNFGRILIGQAELSVGNIKSGTQNIGKGIAATEGGRILGGVMTDILQEIFNNSNKFTNPDAYAETIIAALKKYNNGDSTNVDESNLYYLKASLYLQYGDLSRAFDEIDKAIQSNRGNKQIYVAYAMRSAFREKRGDEQGAKEDFNKALKSTDNLLEVYSVRGTVRYRLGNRQGALTDLQLAANMAFEQKDIENYQKIMSLIDRIQSSPD